MRRSSAPILGRSTAKPSPEQRRRVPHHLLDVADPALPFTVANYQRHARQAITSIRARGRIPLIVGGTGLYIRAVVDDLAIPEVAPDPDVRARLTDETRTFGPAHLHARLAAVDPAAAVRIHPSNTRRVIRALEVTLLTGRPISAQQRAGSAGPVAIVGLTMDRAALYRRIEARVDMQVAAGLVEEVRELLARGIPHDPPALQALGYKEIAGWLAGDRGFEEAVARLKRNTRRYAKRQLTWFRRDPRIVWVVVGEEDAETLAERVHAIMDAEFEALRRG
jgi:tRNA dimethylallyltransferase